MKTSYSGSEFLKALTRGNLKPPIVIEGTARLAQGDEQALLFSEGASCASWVRIPVALIDAVDLVAVVPCQGNDYPYVRIRLKEVEDNPDAAVFADLLRSELNPQPLPPRRRQELNPQPLPPSRS